MRNWTRLSAVVLTAGALLASACGGEESGDGDDGTTTSTTAAEVADRGNVDGTLVIGHLAPLTGSFSAIVSSVTTPVQMAVDEINAAGGVNGEQVRLVVKDDGTDTAITSASLDQLLESERVDAVLGPASSAGTLSILDKVRSSGVLQCSGSATAADLSTADSGGYFFRTAPPDKFQGPALAELLLRDNRTKPAIIARDDAYGVGLARSLASALEDGGASLATEVVEYDPSAPGFDTEVGRLVDASPDSVVVVGFTDDGAKIVSAMIAAGIGPDAMPTYTTDGLQSPMFGATVDPENPGVVAGIKGTAPAAAPAGVESPFNEAFMAKQLPPIFSAYYYDCAILTALSAVKAGSDDAAEMKAAFGENLSGDVDCDTFASCTQALADGDTIHYRGASSRFDKWSGSEPDEGVYDVWSYDSSAESQTEPPSGQIRIG